MSIYGPAPVIAQAEYVDAPDKSQGFGLVERLKRLFRLGRPEVQGLPEVRGPTVQDRIEAQDLHAPPGVKTRQVQQGIVLDHGRQAGDEPGFLQDAHEFLVVGEPHERVGPDDAVSDVRRGSSP
jgi:hypothetical protein